MFNMLYTKKHMFFYLYEFNDIGVTKKKKTKQKQKDIHLFFSHFLIFLLAQYSRRV